MILIIFIFKIFVFSNGQPSPPAEQHIKNVNLGISTDGAGPYSAFEHRLDMPNEVPHSFFEYMSARCAAVFYLTTSIDHAIDENRNKIGDQMYAFVTNLSNICEQLGTFGMLWKLRRFEL
ncbi:hypothetical protein niasHT_000464 [Heterodera trifolii]|uniref:Effector protein n=1 Tax=Heterodera trifolii TaxID=157864 RepID=A0ABD2LYY5_9BILA